MEDVRSQDIVLFERIDRHIAVVTLNRPDKRNAINGAMSHRIYDLIQEVENDKELWVGIIASSNDKVFCAGADLVEVAAGRARDIPHPIGGFAGIIDAPRRKPWIAAVTGMALGGGCEIALACDMRICGEGSAWGLPEVSRGMIAGAGGIYRLPRALPQAVANELIATGGRLPAEKALRYGLVSRVVPDVDVRAEAIRLAQQICENGPIAVRNSLWVARAANDRSEAELREMSREALRLQGLSKDFKEGPKAFVEKRKPNWTGE